MVVRERVATALDNGDMVLYAQPIIDLRNDQVTAYELLLRLRDGRTPHLEPRSFLAPAEHTDLAARIDRWVVGQAIAVLASPHARRRGVRLHVNLTGRTLADPAFGDDLLRDLRRAGVDPFRLGLEVGEAAAVHDADRVRRLVDRLADASCPVVLDDFGSGLGALQSLQRVPYAAVKVAGPLIDHADRSDRDRAVVEGIVRLARGLRLQVIAEEIDRPALLEAVRDAGVRGAQGFLLGAPHPLAQVLPRLR
jgi:EAL domain-containing protein (putative c-di-GMP-specific phosphodiesterase class I)